jgi:hypothetical protein
LGRFAPFPLIGGSYTDDALSWAHQDTVNYLPVVAERSGTRSPSKLAMVPGMRVFGVNGTDPHRGGRDVEGQPYVVIGTKLYRIGTDGTGTACGTIPGTGRVQMTHNQIVSGNQIFISTGSSGYVYNTYTGALTQVTDIAFPGAKSCDFIGQYIVGVEPFGRYWFHSALVDATTYNSLDEYQAETSPDRIMGLIASHNEVLIFGERTIEPWSNTPTENAAFQLQTGSVIETGCASGDTICRLDNSVYFLTDKGQIAKLEGYTPRIISTYAMEGAIRGCDLSRAFAFTWEDKGHTVYYITFPDGYTWGYDVRQGEWHRRESYGLNRWRLNTLFKSNGKWYGGDYQNSKMYLLDWDYALEGCDPIERYRTSPYVHADGERVKVNALQVAMNTGGVQSVIHAGVVVSGAIGGGLEGYAINFQYTVTKAYPGQPYTLTATGLPTGLSMSASGLVTGTMTTSGTYNITISAVDDCGTVTTYADTAVVTSTAFLATGVASAGSIATTRPLSYSGALVGALDSNVTTVTTTTVNGVVRYANKMVVLAGSNLSTADISDLTTWTTGLAYPASGNYPYINVSGSRLFFCNYPATGYYYLDTPTATVWTSVSVGSPIGGGSSNTVSGACGNGSGVIFVGYYGQLWHSLDNGTTVSAAADLYGSDHFNPATFGSADVNDSRFVICGRGLAGFNAYYSDNVGSTATACTFPSGREQRPPGQVKYCGNNTWLMALDKLDTLDTPVSDGLLISIDNGVTFNRVSLPTQMYFFKPFAQSIAVDSGSGRVVIAGFDYATLARKMFYTDLTLLTTGSLSTIWTAISLSGTAGTGIAGLFPT